MFPVLIKLIDAARPLSVQVHPDDAYAQRVEGEPGKTEMWYVVDAQPGAQLYYGFQRELTREEAALYAFNMLQTTMVEYDAKTSVDINGATVTIAGDKAKEVENTSRTDGYIDDDTGEYMESNDAGWDYSDEYYDDYDPWSDPGDGWGDYTEDDGWGDYF